MLGDTSTYAYEGGYARFYIVPEEGTYYIQNVGSGRYVDVEGPSLNDGAAIHEWDFRTNPQEKWIVEHVANSDGYIRLKSVFSNKYIGIDPNALSYVKQYAAQNNYTLWRIERTSSGNLTSQCKVYQGTDAVLTVPSSSTSNGTNLIMAVYTDNATYTDEWLVYKCNYIFYVNHYYDQGYVARFSSIDSNVEGLLKTYQNDVAERFLYLFGIEVSPSYSLCTSTADLCKIDQYGVVDYTHLTGDCPHTTTHLTRAALRSTMPVGSAISTTVIWTGHTMPGNPSPSSTCTTTQMVVITPQNTTIVNKTDGSVSNKSEYNITRESIFDSMHELSHELGAPDHYCRDMDSNNCGNSHCYRCVYGLQDEPDCIMSSFRNDLIPRPYEDIYCEDCISIIINHLNLHHQKGE